MDLRRVFVAGKTGMVGSAITRVLSKNPSIRLVTPSREDLDLTRQQDVDAFFKENRPQEVYLAAAKVGGIYANNTYPAEFILKNLQIQTNVISSALASGVKRLLFLGSSCIYPKFAPQPISEDSLLSGKLERTNEPYAIAKIAGLKLCESINRQFGAELEIDYRAVMPTNLYGPGDNYHPQDSHVIPALIHRFHSARKNGLKEVVVWGTGKALREFLYVDDLAAACVLYMETSPGALKDRSLPFINIGSGEEVSIENLVSKVIEVTNYRGKVVFDHAKPDGTPRKILDSRFIRLLGWKPAHSLEDGLIKTYRDYLARGF